MKKYLDLLEKNVQWIAVGLGGVYLLWTVYAYVWSASVWTVPVGQDPQKPGEIDAHIDTQFAEPLKAMMSSQQVPEMKAPDLKTELNLVPTTAPAVLLAWVTSSPQDIAAPEEGVKTPPNPIPGGIKNPVQPAASAVVVELPRAPAPTDISIAKGRSNVVIPVAGAAVVDPAAPPPDAAQAAVAEPVLNGTDISWVTVSFNISIADLAKEFQRTNIPVTAQQYLTEFLTIEMERQELQSDGSWAPSPGTIVPKLTNATLPPFPNDKAPQQEMQAYKTLAMTKTNEILHPPFYQWVKGDPWAPNKELVEKANQAAAAGNAATAAPLGPNDTRVGFDANTYVGMDAKKKSEIVPPLTNREKQLIAAAQAQKDAEERATKAAAAEAARASAEAARAASRAERSSSSGSGGTGTRTRTNRQVTPQIPRPVPPPPVVPVVVRPAPPVPQAQAVFDNLFPLPAQGEFDPRVVAKAPAPGQGGANFATITAWVHDASVEPGKTYRYRVRYKIKNPIWNTGGAIAKKPELADKFAIVSADSAWTEPVKVDSVITFFVESNSQPGKPIKMQVFRWQDGQLHAHTFSVMPGDLIGGTDNGIDFSTGNTLVDISDIRDKRMAWLLTPDGTLVRRDVQADINSPQHKEMDTQAKASSVATAGGSPPMMK